MKQIPPGSEGKITVKVSTKGYAGRKIREVVRIQTNDDSQPGLSVVVTGFVEQFVEIAPNRVSLVGKVGEPITSQVVIKPAPKYPFEIINVRAQNGKFVKFHLDKQKGTSGWMLTVENTKKEAGRYSDTLILETNSDIQRSLSVRVIGNIME